MQAMFGWMMPRGADRLGLSKMNFGGAGAKMMKIVMKQARVDPLPEMIKIAMEQEIKMIACTMSLDVMGLAREELIDGIDYAGVASYLGEADEANVNLFI